MAGATVTGQAELKGLQHAEQNTILGFFASFAAGFKKGTIAITGYMKTTSVVAGVTVPAIAVMYNISGAGFGAVNGTDVFVVPGPEVGSGFSFAIVASLVGLLAYFRAKRSSAI